MLPHSLTSYSETGTVGPGSAMKIWIKLLLGSVIGVVLGIVLPVAASIRSAVFDRALV